ncbi:putative global regulator [Proteus mirabilis]|uniref:Putative global regulator n=1 Tax=Proteus mirabilis TaxID=584 RepID=A0A2X2C831_PROMI|nr:putative global regulator [Proteus mirabilis]
MTQNSTQTKRPHAAINLPLTLISLDDWSLITATGADSEKYLQGQLTADIAALPTTEHTLAAHCEAKGKMWSTLRIFHQQAGFAYILRKNVAEKQLTELKKYAVFSKVTFTENTDAVLLGLAGQGAAQALAEFFPEIPRKANEVVNHQNSYLLQLPLPTERFLIVTDEETAKKLATTLPAENQ